jgi:hypothetical protein
MEVKTVDRYAQFQLATGALQVDVVLDAADYSDPHQFFLDICDAAGIDPRQVLLVWLSPPCDTYAKCDSTNQAKRCNHREHSKEVWDDTGCALVSGTRDALTELAHQHDALTHLTFSLMLVLWEAYGIPAAMENPHASMRLVPGMRSLLLRPEVCMLQVNYCVFDHPYHKHTDLFSTLPNLQPKGCTGTGRCTTHSHCPPKWGYLNQDTHLWNHHYVLGRDSDREYGVGLDRELFKNKVPENLLQELLDAALAHWGNTEEQGLRPLLLI